jgi:hypothetical protein
MVNKVEVGTKVIWESFGGGGCVLLVTSHPDELQNNPHYGGCFSAVVLEVFNFPSTFIGKEYHNWKLSSVIKVIE